MYLFFFPLLQHLPLHQQITLPSPAQCGPTFPPPGVPGSLRSSRPSRPPPVTLPAPVKLRDSVSAPRPSLSQARTGAPRVQPPAGGHTTPRPGSERPPPGLRSAWVRAAASREPRLPGVAPPRASSAPGSRSLIGPPHPLPRPPLLPFAQRAAPPGPKIPPRGLEGSAGGRSGAAAGRRAGRRRGDGGEGAKALERKLRRRTGSLPGGGGRGSRAPGCTLAARLQTGCPAPSAPQGCAPLRRARRLRERAAGAQGSGGTPTAEHEAACLIKCPASST